jgi:tRNA A37 threonylcarbamoyladenosine dehydratase
MMDKEPFDYGAAFAINMGILSPEEQERLKQAKVCVMGMCAGGTIAVMLTRSGVTHFTLIDASVYELSDINRDIGCYADNIGKSKVEVIAGQIRRINPKAEVLTITQELQMEELASYIEDCDIFFAQSADLALSVHALILAQHKRRLAINVMPSGMTAYVEVFPPDSGKVFDRWLCSAGLRIYRIKNSGLSCATPSTAAGGAGTLPRANGA